MTGSTTLVLLIALAGGFIATTVPSAAWAGPNGPAAAARPNGKIGRTVASWRANRAYGRMLKDGAIGHKLERLQGRRAARWAAVLDREMNRQWSGNDHALRYAAPAIVGVTVATVAAMVDSFGPVTDLVTLAGGIAGAIGGWTGYETVDAIVWSRRAARKMKAVRTDIRKDTVKDALRDGLISGEQERFFRKAGWLEQESIFERAVRLE
jgi:hypothetical protein